MQRVRVCEVVNLVDLVKVFVQEHAAGKSDFFNLIEELCHKKWAFA